MGATEKMPATQVIGIAAFSPSALGFDSLTIGLIAKPFSLVYDYFRCRAATRVATGLACSKW
jgi:hypothetical protein